jgi:hypothetical protein
VRLSGATNYIAGYAGAYVGAESGSYTVLLFGILYDARDDNFFDWDADSRPYILAVISRGFSDRVACGSWEINVPIFTW